MTLVFSVPTVSDGSRRPAARPGDDADAAARIGPRETIIETDRWVSPPDEATLIDGEPHPCEGCDAVFDNEASLRGHSASHSTDE